MSDNVSNKGKKPNYSICKKIRTRGGNEFQPIGVAWAREDGGLYIKLAGTQIIDDGFYAFPNKTQDATQEDGQ